MKPDDNLNKYCEELLVRYNRRNTKALTRHLESLCRFLREEGNHVVQTIFGGSVQKGTYVTGLSDVPVTCPPRTGPGVMLVLGLKERGVKMARRKHTAEQIINKLREAEVAISAGSTVAEVSRQIGVTQQTFYRWRTEYGGLKIDQARRLKQLETENGRLRRAVADLTLDNQILREAAEGNF